MNRVTFLVDGFNLYHSTRDIARYHQGLRVKWLNIHSLCASYVHLLGRDARLEKVYYFSAYAYHLNDPGLIRRHEAYVKCLKNSGVEAEISKFKPKSIDCPHCMHEIIRHEEKETDVAIATKLFELLIRDETDSVALITGDTDLAPAVKVAMQIFSSKRIIFAFPYRRKNDDLASIAPGSFKISAKIYEKHLFPDPVVLSDGTQVSKPLTW
jgi:uncharacterized LabA/DUF88 family protein